MGTAPRFRGGIAPSDLARASFAWRSRILALLVPLIGFALAVSAPAATFTVNSTGDESDPVPSDGVCGTVSIDRTHSGGPCTLRAAIQSANATAAADAIQFSLGANGPGCVDGVCTINLMQVLPDLSTVISIVGPGASQLIVRRAPTGGTGFRIFNVTTAGTVTFSGFTINNGATSDVSSNGGGIANSSTGTVNVDNCTVSNNFTFGGGGGIANIGGGRVNVTNGTFADNGAVGGGGAIVNSNQGIVTVRNSTFTGNTTSAAQGQAPAGGAIGNFSGTTNVTNSTFSGNTCSGPGGAIANADTMSITNCTISGNSATQSGQIGGNLGGGIYNFSNTVNVKSTIIAGNTANDGGPDVNGLFNSAGFNLIGKKDASTGFIAATDKTGSGKDALNPKLDPSGLKNNGGPTKTIALLADSPAIDQGSSAALTGNLTTDQRGTGFPRISNNPQIAPAAGGDNTDIGAFEVQIGPPTRLANLSTRLRVETGDNALIGGFIITGTQAKKVILRAIGPSLSVAGKLENPILELHGPNGLIESNDDWINSPNKQAIIDSTIPPSNNLESAIVQTLPANSTGYTAIVRGVSNGTGIGVVEAYDLDQSVDSKLANISTRGLVQTGDNVLIAGTIILGPTPQKVIVRGIGPSLSVAGRLENPTLELRDSNGTVLEANDNWKDSPNKQAIIDSTIPPTHDLESAIVQTLPANGASYTAILRGVSDTTGIAVVEVYALN
jgi:CSLREA domain-containing protein